MSPRAAVTPPPAIGAVPATLTQGPQRTAREKPVSGSSVERELTSCREEVIQPA
jgi:hypothetical protein